jgi:hypothetical protein
MARKIANYTVTAEGRDKGKIFLITEMSAAHAESWALRVLLALVGANVNLPENFAELGMAGVAELGIRALSGLKWEVAEPLLEEMFECCEIIPDRSKTHVHRTLIDSDIEEVSTRLKLRMEVFKLHTDFLQAVAPSISEGKLGPAAGHGRVSRMSQK